MITHKVGIAALVLSATLASGLSCGGSDGGTCTMASNCGGNLTGNWQVTSSCVHESGNTGDQNCPTATFTGSLQVTGTAAFTAAMTYSLAFVLSGSETINFPAACLNNNGVQATCDQLNQVFATTPPDPTSITSIHCTPAGGGGCNCLANLASATDTESGTYTTSGGSVTTTPSSGGTSSSGYCVMGNKLDLTPPTDPTDLTFTTTGDISLTKQ